MPSKSLNGLLVAVAAAAGVTTVIPSHTSGLILIGADLTNASAS